MTFSKVISFSGIQLREIFEHFYSIPFILFGMCLDEDKQMSYISRNSIYLHYHCRQLQNVLVILLSNKTWICIECIYINQLNPFKQYWFKYRCYILHLLCHYELGLFSSIGSEKIYPILICLVILIDVMIPTVIVVTVIGHYWYLTSSLMIRLLFYCLLCNGGQFLSQIVTACLQLLPSYLGTDY